MSTDDRARVTLAAAQTLPAYDRRAPRLVAYGSTKVVVITPARALRACS